MINKIDKDVETYFSCACLRLLPHLHLCPLKQQQINIHERVLILAGSLYLIAMHSAYICRVAPMIAINQV